MGVAPIGKNLSMETAHQTARCPAAPGNAVKARTWVRHVARVFRILGACTSSRSIRLKLHVLHYLCPAEVHRLIVENEFPIIYNTYQDRWLEISGASA